MRVIHTDLFECSSRCRNDKQTKWWAKTRAACKASSLIYDIFECWRCSQQKTKQTNFGFVSNSYRTSFAQNCTWNILQMDARTARQTTQPTKLNFGQHTSCNWFCAIPNCDVALQDIYIYIFVKCLLLLLSMRCALVNSSMPCICLINLAMKYNSKIVHGTNLILQQQQHNFCVCNRNPLIICIIKYISKQYICTNYLQMMHKYVVDGNDLLRFVIAASMMENLVCTICRWKIWVKWLLRFFVCFGCFENASSYFIVMLNRSGRFIYSAASKIISK